MSLLSAQSVAQSLQPLADFPKQAITIVSPFPPGGGNDKISRLLAAELAGIVGQPVVVENRGGAGGNLGTSSVAKAKPDGYTILTSQTSIIGVNPALYPNAGFVPQKDFEPLSQLTSAPVVFVVRADSPYKSMKDYIADARKRPDVVNFATPGNGTCIQSLIAINTGPNAGTSTLLEFSQGPGQPNLLAGEHVRIFRQVDQQGATSYGFYDYERTAPLAVLAAVFAIVIVVVARWRGLRALAGILIAFGVLAVFMLPALRDGAPAVPVALVASSAILFAVMIVVLMIRPEGLFGKVR
jgi:hypothetical protein